MAKTRVAVLYGGRSVEHGVSINSAKNVFEHLDRTLYEPCAIGIAQNGTWYHTREVTRLIEQGEPLQLILNGQHAQFFTSAGTQVPVDIVFPVLHGTDGEDGSVQGLLQTLKIPQVGTGVLGSALSMNKVITKLMLQQAGIPVAKFQAASFDQKEQLNFEELKQKFGIPFMVKAASLGSSVGVSKVKSEGEFQKALVDAFQYDSSILIEEYISGREIECAILGNDPPEASLPGEIIINPQYEFYTFDAKYVDGDAVQIKVPAELPDATVANVRQLAIKTFETLRGEDFARIDLFVTPEGEVYVNEINTIPGFTNSSMFPMMWQERGLSFTQLTTRLIQLAQEREKKSQRTVTNFESMLKY